MSEEHSAVRLKLSSRSLKETTARLSSSEEIALRLEFPCLVLPCSELIRKFLPDDRLSTVGKMQLIESYLESNLKMDHTNSKNLEPALFRVSFDQIIIFLCPCNDG